MHTTSPLTLWSVNWRRSLCAALLLVLLGSFPPSTQVRAAAPRVDARLLDLAARRPATAVDVIIRQASPAADVAPLVARLGGRVTRELTLINAVEATLPASTLPNLGRAASVRWVSSDARMIDRICSTCVDTSHATAMYLQTTMAQQARQWFPDTQGQNVGVAIIDSGVADHPDLRWNNNNSRVVDVNPSVSPDASPPQPSGLLSGSTMPAPGSVNLSAPATVDWARWTWNYGLRLTRDWPRPALISPLSLIGSSHTAQPNSGVSYTWLGMGSSAGVAVSALNDAFEFTVPADRGLRTLNIYVGAQNAQGKLDAFLSDGSALPFTDVSLTGSGSATDAVYTLVYSAAADGQKLTVRWSHNGGSGRVMLYAATVAAGGADPSPIVTTTSTAKDQYGHGTHVAGIIGGNGRASNGNIIGIAPAANLINVRVNDAQGYATVADVVAGFQWIYENKDRYNIRVVNVSLNSSVEESYHTSALSAAVEILWFNRIVVVVSAGNNGENGKLYPPANDPFVITVGATDDHNTPDRNDDTIAAFSARGTTEAGRTKPEIVAPGVNIVSLSCPTCTMNLAHPQNVVTGFAGAEQYFRASGTSMATPIVAGAVALMLQRDPSLTPDQVKHRLIITGFHHPFGHRGPAYLNIAWALGTNSLGKTNKGIEISHALSSGLDSPLEYAAKWGSAKWGSAKWGSVNWSSAAMTASLQNSVSTATSRK
jgi:subtilisin family serine protease